MPDSNHVIYPPAAPVEPDPIEQLMKLNSALKQARLSLAMFTKLNELPRTDPQWLFRKDKEVLEQIEHWTMTVENLTRCFNSHLTSMMIK